MLLRQGCVCGALLWSAVMVEGASWGQTNPLAIPPVGARHLLVISPTVLEVGLVTSKDPEPARVRQWDFVGENFKLTLPKPDEFRVTVNGQVARVEEVGFKRRAVYAPLKQRDLRLGNHLILRLSAPVPSGAAVVVENPAGQLWAKEVKWETQAAPDRWSPAVHVNHVGYTPDAPKKAMAGYYLGSLGELKLSGSSGTAAPQFQVLEESTKRVVKEGALRKRLDVGFTFPTYQEVWEADFTDLSTPGAYVLRVPGLGCSYPFRIDDGTVAAFARAYALGLYHQRCGGPNELPFTRFLHRPCHTAPALIPTPGAGAVDKFLADMSSDAPNLPWHKAPQLKSVSASLYPFVSKGSVDVAGGHHDAGDYSKYTINSAALVHHLVFAVDAFPGAVDLDNLGLPESGDGKSDLLQEAKWETDFLVKMQDGDGGFCFLVYPRERAYEDDVLPDSGDPQVVFPKTTAVTAAAVAALAQTGSSPHFKRQFPKEAELYLTQARKGWEFIERAIAKHGRDGAYQKVTHYGNEFGHNDELIWAATELFLATGDEKYHTAVKAFDPTDRETKRWTWWRMYEGYGAAIRSYAFGAKSGRLAESKLDVEFLKNCRSEVLASGEDQARFARESAYGTSFPDPTKRFRTAGWYFGLDRAFDSAAAAQLDLPPGNKARQDLLEAIRSNMNYEGGCNPVNVSYLTGVGWQRPRDVVHQYAQNDRRQLPPSGLPIGNVQAGFQYLHHYQKELGALSYPPDGDQERPYPFYDRYGDSFNTTAEFVVVNQARGLGALACLLGESALREQKWRPVAARIEGVPASVKAGQEFEVTLTAPGVDLSQAQVVWEMGGREPMFGGAKAVVWARKRGGAWLEAEAMLPDGRRVFGVTEFEAK